MGLHFSSSLSLYFLLLLLLLNLLQRLKAPVEFLINRYPLVKYFEPRQNSIEKELFEFNVELKNFKDEMRTNVKLNKKIYEDGNELINDFVDKCSASLALKQDNPYKTLARKHLVQIKKFIKQSERFLAKYERYKRNPSLGFSFTEEDETVDDLKVYYPHPYVNTSRELLTNTYNYNYDHSGRELIGPRTQLASILQPPPPQLNYTDFYRYDNSNDLAIFIEDDAAANYEVKLNLKK